MKHEKYCGAVVYMIQNEQLVFLVKHMQKGHTALLKSYMEGNETEEETAKRAIREVTNLEVRLDTVFRHDDYFSPYEGIYEQLIFFTAEVLTRELKKQEYEVSSLEWLSFEPAYNALTYTTDKEVLCHALAYLSIKHSIDMDHYIYELRKSQYGLVWYREHAADIHSHVLVGLDDGAQTMEEAIELLRLDWEEGIRVVFATPHYGIENGHAPSSTDTWYQYNKLTEAAEESVPGMKIKFGTEWYCSDDIVKRISNHEAWSMMPTEWHMVEFLEWGEVTEPAEVMLRRLKNLKDNHINTILAHPERYQAIQQDWDLAKRICDLGVLLQVNAYDLALNPHEKTRNLAQWMAKEELISFIGSDMHGTRPGKRKPRMKEGIRWLYENVDDEYANDIVRRNAEKYLKIDKLPVDTDFLKSDFV